MAVPTVYRWDDYNAPQMTNIHDWTQIKAWFQAIFVNGYLENDNTTTKPALGWTVTEDDTNKKIKLDMVGNSTTHNLMSVDIEFDDQINTSHYSTDVNVYEHQAVNKFVEHNSYKKLSWFGQNDDDLKICPWIVIGTTRGFYVLVGRNNTTSAPNKPIFTDNLNYFRWSFFGDYVNDGVDVGKYNQCAVVGGSKLNSASDMGSYHDSVFNNGVPFAISRNYLSTTITDNYRMISIEMFYGQSYLQPSIGLKYPYVDGGLHIKPMKIFDSIEKVHMGKLPNMFTSDHITPLGSSTVLIEFTGTGTYAGDKFIGLGNGSSGEFYINISADWVT